MIRLLVTVERVGHSKSAWDSYTKSFVGHSEEEATMRLLDWWHALPDDSYTKKLALVNVYVVAPVDVLAPWSVPS